MCASSTTGKPNRARLESHRWCGVGAVVCVLSSLLSLAVRLLCPGLLVFTSLFRLLLWPEWIRSDFFFWAATAQVTNLHFLVNKKNANISDFHIHFLF